MKQTASRKNLTNNSNITTELNLYLNTYGEIYVI